MQLIFGLALTVVKTPQREFCSKYPLWFHPKLTLNRFWNKFDHSSKIKQVTCTNDVLSVFQVFTFGQMRTLTCTLSYVNTVAFDIGISKFRKGVTGINRRTSPSQILQQPKKIQSCPRRTREVDERTVRSTGLQVNGNAVHWVYTKVSIIMSKVPAKPRDQLYSKVTRSLSKLVLTVVSFPGPILEFR